MVTLLVKGDERSDRTCKLGALLTNSNGVHLGGLTRIALFKQLPRRQLLIRKAATKTSGYLPLPHNLNRRLTRLIGCAHSHRLSITPKAIRTDAAVVGRYINASIQK
jgi:hypothetical protein